LKIDLIQANIAKHIILSHEESRLLKSLLEEKTLKKNEYILRQGDPCQHINFVNRGTLRAFFISPNGKESTVMFAIEEWWITDMYAFVNEIPAMVSIKAVESSSVLRLAKSHLETLYEEVPSLNKFFRILMQNAYCREQLRMMQNLSLSSAERYENFLKQYPKVANQVPLKQIASYLGITPEFLSTIRASKS